MGLKESIRELIPEDKRKDADALLEKLDETMAGYDTDIRELKKQLRGKEGVKPEDLANTEKELEAERAARQTAETSLKKITKDYETEKAARGELEGSVNRSTADAEVRRELSALKLSGGKLEELVEGYVPRVTVKLEDKKRVAYIGDKPVKDYFAEWAGTRGKEFIDAPVNQGSGAAGGTGHAAGATTMTRAAFNVLDAAAQSAHVKAGGKLTD